MFISIHSNKVGASQSDTCQPIRTYFSKTTEAMSRPIQIASRDVEQTILNGNHSSPVRDVKGWLLLLRLVSHTCRSACYPATSVLKLAIWGLYEVWWHWWVPCGRCQISMKRHTTHLGSTTDGKPLMNHKNNKGPRTVSCGTPELTWTRHPSH